MSSSEKDSSIITLALLFRYQLVPDFVCESTFFSYSAGHYLPRNLFITFIGLFFSANKRLRVWSSSAKFAIC